MPSEADARIIIDQLLRDAGWDIANKAFVSTEEAAADGRADYLLKDTRTRPLAVVEAKRFSIDPYSAKQQARDYYRRRPDGETETLSRDERQEAEKREEEARVKGLTPPVFIVVCNNTNVSKLVYDYVGGWERQVGDRPIVQAGALPIFRNDDGNDKPWLFPQLLLLIESAHDAADRIYKAIVQSTDGTPALKPILRPYDTLGSTRYVDFDTTRPVYATRADKCHVSHVVADTDSWEQKMAEALEEMDEVLRYVKNHNLGFTIPYTLNGEEHQYYPDFIAVLRTPSPSAGEGRGEGGELNLIIEVTGEKKKDKAAKVATARTLWIPGMNNHGAYGRWMFVEIADPWDAKNTIRSSLPGRISQ